MFESNPLYEWLNSLTGSLLTDDSPASAAQTKELFKQLRLSVPTDLQLAQSRMKPFAFEKIDHPSIAALQPGLKEAIKKLAEEQKISPGDFRVFMRETPIVSINAMRSVADWGSGAKIHTTIGPIKKIEGRPAWFDFFQVVRMAALYISGQSNPALIFAVQTRVAVAAPQGNELILPALTTQYELSPNTSIWIRSNLLATGIDDTKYTGLTITSGSISLSEVPVNNGGRATATASTVFTVKLKLRAPKDKDEGKKAEYGGDAREMKLQMPDRFEFHFSGSQGGKIDVVEKALASFYGQEFHYQWDNQQANFSQQSNLIMVPMKLKETDITIKKSLSPYVKPEGTAKILTGVWGLPLASIDLTQLTEAAGTGGLGLVAVKGLELNWTGLNKGPLKVNGILIFGIPGLLSVTGYLNPDDHTRHKFELWKDAQNPNPSTLEYGYKENAPFTFFSSSAGDELLQSVVNARIDADRPVDVSARPFSIHTKDSVLLLIGGVWKGLMLYDVNLLEDNPDLQTLQNINYRSIALHNALFTTANVSGCFLAGEVNTEWTKVNIGQLFTYFPVFKILPMLPDPYTANVTAFQHFLKYQITDNLSINLPVFSLLSQVKFGTTQIGQPDNAEVRFHLLPFQLPANLQQQNLKGGINFDGNKQDNQEATMAAGRGNIFATLDRAIHDNFALVDVSSNADQLGISFNITTRLQLDRSEKYTIANTGENVQALTKLPFRIDNLQLMAPGFATRSYLLPQIAWEPVNNLTNPAKTLDPPLGLNFYPNDGGATRISNNNPGFVALEPKPLLKSIIDRYNDVPGNITWSYFTLPFGLKAMAFMHKLDPADQQHEFPRLDRIRPRFNNNITGGRQLKVQAGKIYSDDFPMFFGMTQQLPNVLNAAGTPTGAGTLGESVAFIFNKEFELHTGSGVEIHKNRGVPLSRIDFSGYGASIFNNWFNPQAQIAQTSQTKFDVFVGRTAHEIVQVRSIIYPWGIHVVRTVVLYRTNTGYVYRVDTGWRAESDGEFNLNYNLEIGGSPQAQDAGYEFHPGVCKGIYNIENIIEVNENPVELKSRVKKDQYFLNVNNQAEKANADFDQDAVLQKVTFDGNFEIEHVISGGDGGGRVASKGVVGYVQLAPMGITISAKAFTELFEKAGGSIGGPVNCLVDINDSEQHMRINRVDVSPEAAQAGNKTFVVAGRGSVILPKDGSWSMVTHSAQTGEVTPLPEHVTVPLIRAGKLVMQVVGEKINMKLQGDPKAQLLRIANPTEILRNPVSNTINFGFLQNTGTQKALFLTPAFKFDTKQLLSKTPPLFADAYRVMNSKGIFPNIGNAVDNFKEAIVLDAAKFNADTLMDAGKQVLKVMEIGNVASAAEEKGYKLLKTVQDFDLPSTEFYLIKEEFLKIYVEYKAKPKGGSQAAGKLNFDVDSFVSDTAKKWKSRMNNLAMVVDLGPFKRLMTVKGNFDAKKGKETSYSGQADGESSGLPTPEIEFSDALQTAMDILEILQKLGSGDYEAVLKKGLKIAMSNNAGTYEYKFDAAKEIPVIKFPAPALQTPQTPLILEASLKVGFYFNGALMVTTNPEKLLPTAGAYVDFYGQLRVMCFTVGGGSIYAIGQVNLGIAADTAKGPSLAMKFGFGVQLAVGLPVVGNVSVTYMVGVELYIDKDVVAVTAFMLFKGHAELLGGLVGVTITIEAKGTIIRSGGKTECSAQVTFALDISICFVIDLEFSESWGEDRQIA